MRSEGFGVGDPVPSATATGTGLYDPNALDWDDEVVAGACVVRDGKVVER